MPIVDEKQLLEDFHLVLNKLLEAKPELKEWAEINFGKYNITIGDNNG